MTCGSLFLLPPKMVVKKLFIPFTKLFQCPFESVVDRVDILFIIVSILLDKTSKFFYCESVIVFDKSPIGNIISLKNLPIKTYGVFCCNTLRVSLNQKAGFITFIKPLIAFNTLEVPRDKKNSEN